MRFGPTLYVLGFIFLALGVAMSLAAGLDLWLQEGAAGSFAASAFVTLFLGGALILANRTAEIDFDLRQAYMLTALAWTGAAALGALPFLFALRIGYADAFFESMSGLTTTGSTVLTGLDTMPHAILLWRALLQWMGGLGIIVMAIAILPFLRVGGMQLFKTESSDRSDKVMPRPGQVAAVTAQVYVVLSAACALAYLLAGMSGFDALTHAMTTLSTGGFANYDASFAAYENPTVHWIGTAFMILGGCPFVLYVRMLQGAPGALLGDAQVRTFLGVLFVSVTVMTLWLVLAREMEAMTALRVSAFNLASIVTTTGFALGDYTLWGDFAAMLVFLLTFIGACSGSTAGAMKLFRLQIIYLALRMQIHRMIYPHGILPRRYGSARLTDDIVSSVLVFVSVYLLTVVLLAVVLAFLGADFVTALTGAATAVGNVGPGLGPVIGPAGNFVPLSDAQIWVLAFGMLMGRLELMTILVLLTPVFWRN